ncbi:MAG: glycoside hydrolase [Opitutaceae bacterium]|nr:glycoside hydrolase [Opitutaceae bacterium]
MLALACNAAPPARENVRHVIVYHNEREFAGWPANEGMWSWGDEILVAYDIGKYQKSETGHSVTGRLHYGFSRSKDGGLTWQAEPHPDVLHYVEIKPERTPYNHGPVNFGAPGFAMKLRQHSYYLSEDRGRTWNGPWRIPRLPDPVPLARTCHIVTGGSSALVFLTSAPETGHPPTERGRSSVIETKDAGRSWELLSYIGNDPGAGLPAGQMPAFSIMPDAVRISPDHFVAAVRCRINRAKWTDIHESTDHCRTWRKLVRLEQGSNNPVALAHLGGKAIAAIYGWRGHALGIRARISKDGGRRWGGEIILRRDASSWDIGYTRAVVRPDGAVVVVYYYTTKERPQPHIEATIWHPDI